MFSPFLNCMNLYFIKKTLYISIYFIFFILFRDVIYALLIRFYDPWLSSFVILPSIILIILLITKIYLYNFNSSSFKINTLNFNFLFKILFICLCLYIYSQLIYNLLARFDLFYFTKTERQETFIYYFTFVLAAVVEELFFRGILLNYAVNDKLLNTKLNLVYFSVLTSVLFSIAHMRFDLFIFQYFIFSLICSFIFIKSKKLLYTIFFHSFYNIVAALNIGGFLSINELNIYNTLIILIIFLLLIIGQMFKLKYN